MKRAFLLVATNLAIIVALGIVWNILDSVFGISQVLVSMGIPAHFGFIALMALVMGFGGAFLSLWISKWMAKRSMGVVIIDQPSSHEERWLLNTVQRQADIAGIAMPEVGIFQSPDINAFATGARKNDALVAVSSALLVQMTPDEAEAVLGHEIAHIANGDMVTQTLLQGVLNTFVILFARIIGYVVDSFLSQNNDDEGQSSGLGMGYFITSIVMDILLGILASMIVMCFSRWREFHADQGGARLAGKEKMIAALKRLQKAQATTEMPAEMAAFGINGGMGEGIKKLFMSHPPLEERIAALEASDSRTPSYMSV